MLQLGMLLDFLFVLSIKFLLFDFILFKKVRDWLFGLDNYFVSKLLRCPFCQGFWIGLFYSFFSPYSNLVFAFSTAILCLMWNVIFWPLIDRYEEQYNITNIIKKETT